MTEASFESRVAGIEDYGDLIVNTFDAEGNLPVEIEIVQNVRRPLNTSETVLILRPDQIPGLIVALDGAYTAAQALTDASEGTFTA